MIRVSLLRLTIIVSKAAITVSAVFKPATWKRIAIVHSLLGLSFLLVYGFLVRFSGTIFQTDESQTAIETLTTDMEAKTDDLFNGVGVKGARIEECVNEPASRNRAFKREFDSPPALSKRATGGAKIVLNPLLGAENLKTLSARLSC